MHKECIAPIASSTEQDAIVSFECSCKNNTHGLDNLCSLEGETSGEVRCYTVPQLAIYTAHVSAVLTGP